MDAAEREARVRGHFIARVDGRAAPDKAALLARLAEALKFPAYFGGNLDALADCLSDLGEFAPAPGHLLLIEHASAACPADRTAFAAVVAVLEDAARASRSAAPPSPFTVVLSD